MRCTHGQCGGLIVHDTGDFRNRPRDYCYSCGREPKKAGETTSGGLRDASLLGSMPERIMPDQKRDPALNDEDTMGYHLNPAKEEEVKTFLKDHSIREIVVKTGVASQTITRIRNENFTEEERAEMKTRAMSKPRENYSKRQTKHSKKGFKTCSKCKEEKALSEFTVNSRNADGLEYFCRECKKVGDTQRRAHASVWDQNKALETKTGEESAVKVVLALPDMEKIEPAVAHQEVEISKSLNPEITKFINFRIPEGFDFVDIARKYAEYLDQRMVEITDEIKKLAKEYTQAVTHLTLLGEFLQGDENDKELTEDQAFRNYIEMESECMEELPCEETK